jgi:hypothetical protein
MKEPFTADTRYSSFIVGLGSLKWSSEDIHKIELNVLFLNGKNSKCA